MHTPDFWGFPCSQAHNLLTCDQPDPKDNFSPVKKVRHIDPNLSNGPLKGINQILAFFARKGSLGVKLLCSETLLR